jgi:Domain of unknown function (DUF6458)
MGMRVSIFLVCVGALLAVGTNVSVSGVDLTVVGITLVGAGAIGLLITLLVWDPRPRVAGVQRSYPDPLVVARPGLVEQPPMLDERRAYRDPSP